MKNEEIAIITDAILAAAERRLSNIYGRKVTLAMEIEEVEQTTTPHDIIKCVSETLFIPIAAMKSPTRKREVVEARMISMAIIITNNKKRISLKNIGSLFGGKDHSTVIHARQTVEDLVDTNKKFKFKYTRCVQALQKRINMGAKATILLPANV